MHPVTAPTSLRVDLAGDAVRLATMLHGLVPEAGQVTAMLALLLLQHSRRDAARSTDDFVTLADQDRWGGTRTIRVATPAYSLGCRQATDTPKSSVSRP